MILSYQQYTSRSPGRGVQKGGPPGVALPENKGRFARVTPELVLLQQEHMSKERGQSCSVLGSWFVLNSPKNISIDPFDFLGDGRATHEPSQQVVSALRVSVVPSLALGYRTLADSRIGLSGTAPRRRIGGTIRSARVAERDEMSAAPPPQTDRTSAALYLCVYEGSRTLWLRT